MPRLVEVALFLCPFVLFGLWRLAAVRGFPSQAAVVASGLVLLVMLGWLIWFSEYRSIPGSAFYVPAHVENGRVIPGHAAP